MKSLPATNSASEATPLLVDVREAAAILGLTVNQFRGCIARGEIVVTKKFTSAGSIWPRGLKKSRYR